MHETTISANIAKVLEQVSSAAAKYDRDPRSIRLMAVSKTQPAEAVMAAAQAGLRDFGENYVQEALAKIDACKALDLVWHYIGPIQSNKTRAIAEHFDWVHSVDRAKILRRLSEQRPAQKPPLNLCIQINVSQESSKSGATADELPELLALAGELPNLKLRGLMAIPAPSTTFSAQKAACDELARLFDQAREHYPALDTLSMGMSGDMEAAIASGSTMLRIGTALFGQRRSLAGQR